jgi:hypothetical protein
METEPKPYISCPECTGKGIAIGPVDESSGKREIRECRRCAGGGALILDCLRNGEPQYRTPRTLIG